MLRARRTTVLMLSLTVLISFVSAPSAFAQNPFYLLGKLGGNALDGDLLGAFTRVADGDDTSWGVGVGFKLNKHIAFQLEVNDLGGFSGDGGECGVENPCTTASTALEADSSMISGTFLPHLPLGERFALYGKLGLVKWESEVSEIVDTEDIFVNDREGWDVVYGAGLRLQLPGPVGVFAEYERTAEVFDNVSLGATLGF